MGILVNVEVALPEGSRIICEVQLYIDAFLALKKMQHKTYEVARASPDNYLALLKPLFKRVPVPLDGKTRRSVVAEARSFFTGLQQEKACQSDALPQEQSLPTVQTEVARVSSSEIELCQM